MTFWDFLNWLFGAIDKVLAFFGSAFWTLYNGASNALSWAIDFSTSAYNAAKTWVVTQAYAFSADVVGFVNNLSDRIVATVNYAGTVATNAYNNAVAWVNRQSFAVVTYVNGLIDSTRAWTQGELQSIIVGLTDVINQAKVSLHSIFDPLLILTPGVALLADLAKPDTYNRIKTIITDMFSTLHTIVDDPLGFLTGMLFPVFAEIFCYAVGYGLGALESQLPPLPGWGKSGGGGTYPPPVIPPGSGQLVHPIDPIWVSGYTFNPPTHPGVDLGLSLGQEVYAMHNGAVIESGWSNVGYGNTILLQNDTFTSRYGHLETCIVQAGQQVSAGQLIGYGDTTGNSTGNHLHLELKINGTYVNPLLYL